LVIQYFFLNIKALLKMIIKKTIYGQLPILTLTDNELKAIVIKLLKRGSSTFDFIPFTKNVKNSIIEGGRGIENIDNTVYIGDLSPYDISRVREILWDLIIERVLTPGGNGHDNWPTITITKRGEKYLESIIL